jgi:hypothetical protein
VPLALRTWAPRGQTPVLLRGGPHRVKGSAVAALTIPPGPPEGRTLLCPRFEPERGGPVDLALPPRSSSTPAGPRGAGLRPPRGAREPGGGSTPSSVTPTPCKVVAALRSRTQPGGTCLGPSEVQPLGELCACKRQRLRDRRMWSHLIDYSVVRIYFDPSSTTGSFLCAEDRTLATQVSIKEKKGSPAERHRTSSVAVVDRHPYALRWMVAVERAEGSARTRRIVELPRQNSPGTML